MKIKSVVKQFINMLIKQIHSLQFVGFGRFCPICGKHSRTFKSFGVIQRDNAQCNHCGSLERHRFLWLFLQKTNLFNRAPKRMLHIAPEECLEKRFREILGPSYITADLLNPKAMIKMDITDINFANESFDAIYCSHVFEHILDDLKAMSELYRVLKNDGWAILLVPIDRETTYEDPTIISPEERLKAFGLEDHVRAYGKDYIDRLRSVGFTVEISKVSDLCDKNDVARMGLVCDDIYFCTKQ